MRTRLSVNDHKYISNRKSCSVCNVQPVQICSMINTSMFGYILVGLQFFLEIYIFVEKMGEINFYKWPQLGTRHGGNQPRS